MSSMSGCTAPLSPSRIPLRRHPQADAGMSPEQVIDLQPGTKLQVVGKAELHRDTWHSDAYVASSSKQGGARIPLASAPDVFKEAADYGLPVLVQGTVDDNQVLTVEAVDATVGADETARKVLNQTPDYIQSRPVCIDGALLTVRLALLKNKCIPWEQIRMFFGSSLHERNLAQALTKRDPDASRQKTAFHWHH